MDGPHQSIRLLSVLLSSLYRLLCARSKLKYLYSDKKVHIG
jgi:hypothetical protein